MSSPSSCPKCERLVDILSSRGLCSECAATDDSVDSTPRIVLPAPSDSDPSTATSPPSVASDAPTASIRVAGATTDAPAEVRPLPHPPAGYEILEALGRGGMGDVYLAREQASERLVAMKFLLNPGSADAYDRFIVELRVLAKLDHPNIVRVLAPDVLRGQPYFTMEYLSGGSLSRSREGAKPLPVAEAVRLFRTVAAAVAAAHTQNVIHRDLKPSNILLDANGVPKVADFGLAKRLDEYGDLTATSGMIGTPAYMPPEQICRKNGAIGPWSDVYGLGATLYALLTDRPPFVGPAPVEIIHQVLADAPQRPRALRPEIPLGLEAIVMKCLAKDSKERYQTVAELLADLDRYEAGLKPVAPQQTRVRRLKQWAGRNRGALAGAVLAMVMGVGLVAAGRAFAPVPTIPRPEPALDPAVVKAERLKVIYSDWREGKPIPLLGKEGEPLWWESPTGPITFSKNPYHTDKEPGGCYFSCFNPTLLSFPDPITDRYRVELEIQHAKGFNGADQSSSPSLGFFFGYKRIIRPDGWTEQPLLSVGFHDHARMVNGLAKPSAIAIESHCYLSQPGQAPGTNQFPIIDRPLDSQAGFPGPWRKIIADFRPEGVAIYWLPKPNTEPEKLIDLSVSDIASVRASHDLALSVIGPKLRHEIARLPAWTPHQGMGIWANNAEIAIRNVILFPFPTRSSK